MGLNPPTTAAPHSTEHSQARDRLGYSPSTSIAIQNAMKLAPDDLDKITATTLGHYNTVAEDFREGTRDHDVSQNIDALLRHLQGTAPFTVLDFGCGPGRDLRTWGISP